MLAGACVPCREDVRHCEKCSIESNDVCDKCDVNIATKDANGKCSQCTGGWVATAQIDGSTKCKCPDEKFVNVKRGRKCESCGEIIKGCGECE